jgi:hypothetical protein
MNLVILENSNGRTFSHPHRGTPQQREMPVAPTIVGRGEYGDLIKKDYLVTQAKKEVDNG